MVKNLKILNQEISNVDYYVASGSSVVQPGTCEWIKSWKSPPW